MKELRFLRVSVHIHTHPKNLVIQPGYYLCAILKKKTLFNKI